MKVADHLNERVHWLDEEHRVLPLIRVLCGVLALVLAAEVPFITLEMVPMRACWLGLLVHVSFSRRIRECVLVGYILLFIVAANIAPLLE